MPNLLAPNPVLFEAMPTNRSTDALGKKPLKKLEDKPTRLNWLFLLSLVPCNVRGFIRGRIRSFHHEPAFRLHKGRPRRKAGRRFDLSRSHTNVRPVGWLASPSFLPERRSPLLGRNLFPKTRRRTRNRSLAPNSHAISEHYRRAKEELIENAQTPWQTSSIRIMRTFRLRTFGAIPLWWMQSARFAKVTTTRAEVFVGSQISVPDEDRFSLGHGRVSRRSFRSTAFGPN